MSADAVDVGSAANDGTGDTLRAGFQEVNKFLQKADASTPAKVHLLEDTDDGTNKVIITFTGALAADRTLSLPTGGNLDLEVVRGFAHTAAASGTVASVQYFEDTDNGTNKVTISAPSAMAADRALTLISGGDLDLETVRVFTHTAATSGTAAYQRFLEDTDNGTNYCDLLGPSSAAANRTCTLPSGGNLDLENVRGFAHTAAASGVASSQKFLEDSDNGTNGVTVTAPASTADVTFTLPASTLDMANVADFAFAAADASGPAQFVMKEDTDNGANGVTVLAPASTADVNFTLPTSTLDMSTLITQIQEPSHVSVVTPHADTVSATFKVVDAVGTDVAAVTPFRCWLSSDNTTGAIHGTAADGGLSCTTGLELQEEVSGLMLTGVTDSSGDAVVSINHAGGAVAYYLWVQIGAKAAASAIMNIT